VNYTAGEVASSEHAVMLGNCTWTLLTAQADYGAAVSICGAHGMHLASVHSPEDNAALAGLASKYPKWGAGVAANGSVLVGLRFNASMATYVWQDGSELDWSHSSINATQAPAGRECVAVLADGSWRPTSCTAAPASFICQRGYLLSTATNATQPSGSEAPNATITNNTNLVNCVAHLCGMFTNVHTNASASSYNITLSSSNDTTAAASSFMTPWAATHPLCMVDNATWFVADYYYSGTQENKTWLCSETPANIFEWAKHNLAAYQTSSSVCGNGIHTTTTQYATVNWTISVWQATPTAPMFLKLVAELDPLWEQQQRDQQRRFSHWKAAILPMLPAQSSPPAVFGWPLEYQVSVLEDSRCQANVIRAPLFGGYALLHVRVVPAADGAYVEVWGYPKYMDAQEDFWGPTTWTRSAAKFLQLLP
jgi:hypothetical protein